MQSVGEKLKRARLEKGISLDTVYKQTKMHTRVLEALEQDRAHNFLNLVYVKGFLKTYAQYLGLDSGKLLKEYTDSQKEEVHPAPVTSEKKSNFSFQLKPFLIFRVAFVLVLSFVFILYFRFVLRRINEFPPEAKMQKVKIEVLPAPAAKLEDLVVEVRTKDDCWLHVKADNQTLFKRTLSKGKRERWQAKRRIELRIGRPEVLEVFLNGEPIDLKKAKVKKGLVVTHEGIVGN